MPAVRERFRVLMDWLDHPQMVLRLGVPSTDASVLKTNRLPLSAVLTIEE
jgi:hypothetical protein